MKSEIKLYNFLLALTLLCIPAYILLMLGLSEINAYYSAILAGGVVAIIIYANILNKEIKALNKALK